MKITKNDILYIEVIPTSKQLKNLRTKLKLTQQEFANILWVSRLTVLRWENGKTQCRGCPMMLINILTKFDLWNQLKEKNE